MASIITSASESVMTDWRPGSGRCAPPASPALGTLKRVSGDGLSVGSVISLQCPARHRPVSGVQISCVWSHEDNSAHWSGGTPECRPLSRLEDGGFRLALLLSFISSAIILIMSIIFITSCLLRYVKRDEKRKMERARKKPCLQHLDTEDVELQRETLHNQKSTNNNDNQNNNNNNRSGEEKQLTGAYRITDTHISAHTDLSTPYRCLQLHPCRCSVILHPPSDCPLLQDQLWLRAHT